MPKLSRHLNENQAFLGISIVDMLIIIGSFLIVDSLLSETSFKIFSFGYLILIFVTIVTLRFKTRRKIIRDFIFSTFNQETIYDPKIKR